MAVFVKKSSMPWNKRPPKVNIFQNNTAYHVISVHSRQELTEVSWNVFWGLGLMVCGGIHLNVELSKQEAISNKGYVSAKG